MDEAPRRPHQEVQNAPLTLGLHRPYHHHLHQQQYLVTLALPSLMSDAIEPTEQHFRQNPGLVPLAERQPWQRWSEATQSCHEWL